MLPQFTFPNSGQQRVHGAAISSQVMGPMTFLLQTIIDWAQLEDFGLAQGETKISLRQEMKIEVTPTLRLLITDHGLSSSCYTPVSVTVNVDLFEDLRASTNQ